MAKKPSQDPLSDRKQAIDYMFIHEISWLGYVEKLVSDEPSDRRYSDLNNDAAEIWARLNSLSDLSICGKAKAQRERMKCTSALDFARGLLLRHRPLPADLKKALLALEATRLKEIRGVLIPEVHDKFVARGMPSSKAPGKGKNSALLETAKVFGISANTVSGALKGNPEQRARDRLLDPEESD